MTEQSKMRLGRKAVKRDSRTLRLARYLKVTEMAPPPVKLDWGKGLSDFGMMLNDQLGDCTIAGCAHAVQIWSMNSGAEETISDPQILNTYSAWDGYVPGNPETDQGGIELDVLTKFKAQGFCGHGLNGFAAVSISNVTELRKAIELFGLAYIGIGLPLTAANQDVWDFTGNFLGNAAIGSWGGHCVILIAYDFSVPGQEWFECITWGKRKRMTLRFLQNYCDEAYALFGTDWLNKDGKSPEGLDINPLTADLAAIH